MVLVDENEDDDDFVVEKSFTSACDNICKEGQPIFIDMILKIILTRVYVNIRARKLLTAESILRNARDLLKHFKGKQQKMKIVTERKLRGEARPFELTTLEKKYLLLQGILAENLSKPVEAQDSFLTCMQIGE